jgi:predicted nucleotidyltransferase/predicted transcriptional regulator with HTH domain
MLEALITSKTKRKVLELLFMNSKKRFYLREICRKTDENTNAVSLELKKLQKAKITTSHKEANMIYYSANEECSIFSELKNIIAKTSGISDSLKDALGKYSNIKYAFIYGSFAKGDDRPISDIDLMIIGKIDKLDKFSKSIRRLEQRYSRDINYSIYPESEFRKKSKEGYILDVLRGKKIMLIGDESELK